MTSFLRVQPRGRSSLLNRNRTNTRREGCTPERTPRITLYGAVRPG
jgi:hypothetical protein